jgi:uncharacterized protein YukE
LGRPSGWDVVDQGDDPVKGDPSTLRLMAREYRRISDAADDASTRLRSVKGSGWLTDWQGEAADVFVDAIKDTPSDLGKLVDSYSRASTALSRWADTVDDAQYRADGALADAKDAAGDLASAQSRLSDAQSTLSHYQQTSSRLTSVAKQYPAGSDVPDGVDVPTPSQLRAASDNATVAQGSVSSAQGDISAAQSRIDAAKRLVAEAKGDWQDGEQRTAKAIGDAADAGLGKQSFWDKVFGSEAWSTIVSIAKVVVFVGGIVAMIIPGPWTLIIAAIALVVVADTLFKMSKGQADGWDLAFALLDCVPLASGIGRAAGVARAVGKVASATRATSAATRAGSALTRATSVVPAMTKSVSNGMRVRRTLNTISPELRTRVIANGAVKSRSYIRAATRRAVIAKTERTVDGDLISGANPDSIIPCARAADGTPLRVHPATGRADPEGMTIPEDGAAHFGHAPGHEWSEFRIDATERGLSRAQVNDAQNDPSIYRLETPKENSSHVHELGASGSQ